MTTFHLGDSFLPDAEELIERQYFLWGQEWGKQALPPHWEDASPEQRRAIALRGYAMYDGLPAQPGDTIGPTECYYAVGMSARIVLFDVVRLIARADEVRPYLAAIPNNRRLEDATNEELEAVGKLFDVLDACHQIGIAKITKVLHKKRPAFIPVIDSLLMAWMCRNCFAAPRRYPSNPDLLPVFKDLLIDNAAALAPIHANICQRGFVITKARLLDFLLFISEYHGLKA